METETVLLTFELLPDDEFSVAFPPANWSQVFESEVEAARQAFLVVQDFLARADPEVQKRFPLPDSTCLRDPGSY